MREPRPDIRLNEELYDPADLPDRAVQPHVERPTKVGGKTYCACGSPWPCDRAVQPEHPTLFIRWGTPITAEQVATITGAGFALQRVDGARAASQERPTIDVKRLAEAMWGHQPADLRDTDTGSLHCGRECAEAIGGEYDRLSRLSSPEPVEPGE
jgi:hypothetical protein